MAFLWGNGLKPWTQFTFQPARTYAQYDLAALVSIPVIDGTMTDALASVDKSMHSSVAPRELATITSDYATKYIFYTNGLRIRDAQQKLWDKASTGETIFSAEISAIMHIQICLRGWYLILSDSLSSLITMRSRRITYKTNPWVYDSKQIYWDLQQLNYDGKTYVVSILRGKFS
jgi:hypothetical protein